MPNNVGYKPTARRIVHHFPHQRPCLSPIVVILTPSVGCMNKFAARLPLLHIRKVLRISRWAAFRVRRVDRIGHILDPHLSVFAIAMEGALWRIDWNLLVVNAWPGTIRFGMGEESGQ